jgi:hypothetical protein
MQPSQFTGSFRGVVQQSLDHKCSRLCFTVGPQLRFPLHIPCAQANIEVPSYWKGKVAHYHTLPDIQ